MRRSERGLLTVDRTMAYGPMSRRTVYRLLDDGTFSKIKRGHRRVIKRKEVDLWKRKQRLPHKEMPDAAE